MIHRSHLCALAAIAAAAAWLAWPRADAGKATARPSPTHSEAPEHDAPDGLRTGHTGGSLAAAPVFLLRSTADEWRGEATREALSAALCQLAEVNPAQALPLLARVPDDAREAIQQEVAAAMIATHPLESVKLLDALPPSETTDQMLRQAGMEFAVRDLPAAMEWARAQPDAELRALLLSAALCVQAEQDPAEAAADMEELPHGALRLRLVAEIAQRWEARDAEAAAAFLTAHAQPNGITTGPGSESGTTDGHR